MDMNEIIQTVHFSSGAWVILLPCALMLLDVLTGFVNAWVKHDVRSDKMRSGLAKKIGEIAAICIAELFACAMELPTQIVTAISIYICIMELVSNVENLALLGVPMPSHWKDKLDQVQHYYFPDKDDDSPLDIEHSASEDSDEDENHAK